MREVVVELRRRASALALEYTVRGDIRRVDRPERHVPARADELWKHTCFEAFVGTAQSAAYWEFNLSPSRQWAAYRFRCYREDMTAETAITDPHIELQSKDPELRLSAALELSGVAALPADEDWRVGLSAIIEDENGDKSYWALAHPPGAPDFHHPEGFFLVLSPREGGGR